MNQRQADIKARVSRQNRGQQSGKRSNTNETKWTLREIERFGSNDSLDRSDGTCGLMFLEFPMNDCSSYAQPFSLPLTFPFQKRFYLESKKGKPSVVGFYREPFRVRYLLSALGPLEVSSRDCWCLWWVYVASTLAINTCINCTVSFRLSILSSFFRRTKK